MVNVTVASPQVQQQILGQHKPAQLREVQRASWESGLGMADPSFDGAYQAPIPPTIPWSGEFAPLPEELSAVSPDIMSLIAKTRPPSEIEAWLLKNKTTVYAVVVGLAAFALLARR